MQGIVSDTTPLNYLVLIKAIDILPRLYERVPIPPAVRAELETRRITAYAAANNYVTLTHDLDFGAILPPPITRAKSAE
jgi:predicted nucleic acid-binding protein